MIHILAVVYEVKMFCDSQASAFLEKISLYVVILKCKILCNLSISFLFMCASKQFRYFPSSCW